LSSERVVIVTGATSGLGKAMALALAAAGHCVAGTGRTAQTVEAFAAECGRQSAPERVLGITADVRVPDDCARVVAATVARFGRVDGLVNNAGVHLPSDGPRPKFYELTAEAWLAIVDTHLNGAFHMTRAVVPHLLARGWGRIVNHETTYDTMFRPGFTPYGAAKAGIEVATAAWAQELAGTGVTVNAILPGGVADVPRISRDAFPDRSKLVQPGLLGPPIVWLFSSAADAFTGRRVTARSWNRAATESENLAAAVTPAGFPTSGDRRPAARPANSGTAPD